MQNQGIGLAKISPDALQENINFYRSLNEVQKQENYFGLIRMNLGKIDYHLLEPIKKLSEINTVEDLKIVNLVLKANSYIRSAKERRI